MDLSFGVSDSIFFLDYFASLWGLLFISAAVVIVAVYRPYIAIAILCFYPNILWAASWKPFVTLYPIYFLFLVLCLRYARRIFICFFTFRYKLCILIPFVIVTWSFLSPWLYPVHGSNAFSLASNPNYKRWLEIIFPLLILPAAIESHDEFREFMFSVFLVIIGIHFISFLASGLFIVCGHPVYEIHRMVFLNMRPIYWESGLLLLFIAYAFVHNRFPPFILVLLALVGCIGLVLGNSRTRVLSTFVCFIYFIYPYVSRRLFFWGIAFVLSFSLVAGGAAVFSGKINVYIAGLIEQRIEQSMSKDEKVRTSGRARTYQYALDRWQANPLLGVGSCYIYPTTKFTSQASIGRLHNYYLEVLAGQGGVGFVLLLAVLGISAVMAFKIFRAKAKESVDGRMAVALLVWGLINWMFKESWGITYTAICLLSIYIQTGQKKTLY
nr:O-antigen ligase family protein [uncultured Desulfobacter sp.]